MTPLPFPLARTLKALSPLLLALCSVILNTDLNYFNLSVSQKFACYLILDLKTAGGRMQPGLSSIVSDHLGR